MMRQMRENTQWIMLVTAVAFVGLMVFQWGMDITGRSGMSVGETLHRKEINHSSITEMFSCVKYFYAEKYFKIYVLVPN